MGLLGDPTLKEDIARLLVLAGEEELEAEPPRSSEPAQSAWAPEAYRVPAELEPSHDTSGRLDEGDFEKKPKLGTDRLPFGLFIVSGFVVAVVLVGLSHRWTSTPNLRHQHAGTQPNSVLQTGTPVGQKVRPASGHDGMTHSVDHGNVSARPKQRAHTHDLATNINMNDVKHAKKELDNNLITRTQEKL